jgi:hypothetical protein
VTPADLAHLVGVWRSARCPYQHAKLGEPLCDGDSHAEQCPVELARQDLLAAHNALGAPGM